MKPQHRTSRRFHMRTLKLFTAIAAGFMAFMQRADADVVLPSVSGDATAPHVIIRSDRWAGVVVDYRGPLAANETLYWEKDLDSSTRLNATDRNRLLIYPDYLDTGLYQPVVVSPQAVRRGQFCRIEVMPQPVLVNVSARVTLTA